MAIAATAVFRIRVGGDDTNGAGYDPAISGAGTDYSQQDAAQLALTDIVCANTTTVTSVTGGFTSAMIGNAIYLTGGGATAGHYFITARTNTNTITVDRAAGTISAGNGKVGGAAATPNKLLDGGRSAGDVAVPGNTVYIRGSGTRYPTSDDYVMSTFYNHVQGDTTSGFISILGENGRPRIHQTSSGLLFYNTNYIRVQGIYVFNGSANSAVLSTNYSTFFDCAFDMNNVSGAVGVYANGNNVMVYGCEVFSHLTSPTGTSSFGIIASAAGGHIVGCKIHHVGGIGLALQGSTYSAFLNNEVYKNKNYGIEIYGDLVGIVAGNTVDANEDDGIHFTNTAYFLNAKLFNNIISNHTQGGANGQYVPGSATLHDKLTAINDYNAYFNNTTHVAGYSGGPHDVMGTDPQYTSTTNGSEDYTPTNTAMAFGFPAAF